MIHRHHPAIGVDDAVLLGEILLREGGFIARVAEVLAHQLGHPVVGLTGAAAGVDAGDDEGHFGFVVELDLGEIGFDSW